jgi:hypothetical protein
VFDVISAFLISDAGGFVAGIEAVNLLLQFRKAFKQSPAGWYEPIRPAVLFSFAAILDSVHLENYTPYQAAFRSKD